MLQNSTYRSVATASILIALAAGAGAWAADAGNAPATTQSTDLVAVSGTVVLGDTGDPVPECHVYLTPLGSDFRDGVLAIADRKGFFAIRSQVRAGEYTIQVMQGREILANQRITLAHTPAAQTLHIKTDLGGISGHIVTSEGRLASGATVMLKKENDKTFYVALSDSKGNYSIAHVAPGKYDLLVTTRHQDKLNPSTEPTEFGHAADVEIGHANIQKDITLQHSRATPAE